MSFAEAIDLLAHGLPFAYDKGCEQTHRRYLDMRHKTLKLIFLAAIFAVALVMGSMALAQISAVDDYLVEHLADIADHPGYIVRARDGFLSVYYKGRGYPVYISNIALISLRGRDREDAEKGITVATRRELIELLEDLGS